MRNPRRSLTYSNVVATIALFLALSGGVVLAASKISGSQIKQNSLPGNRVKKNSLPGNRLKKKTLTNTQIKPGTIQRTALAPDTLSGLIVADAGATNLPGATTHTPPGPTALPLTGTASFTPAAGKSYQLQAELLGNPVPVSNEICRPGVQIYVNGVPTTWVELWAYNELEPGFDKTFPEGSGTTNLLTEAGTQTITAKVFGSEGCASTTALSRLRVIVVQLG